VTGLHQSCCPSFASSMLSLRLLRARAPARAVRLASTTAHPTVTRTSSPSSVEAAIPLSNVEAQWERLTPDEQLVIHRQLEELQKKDWKSLSLDEKRAAYYIAFGPHGPRAPIKPPGSNVKIMIGIVGGIGLAGVIYGAIRAKAPPPPRTQTREWQEAMNERSLEKKHNPITGISSEGYKGKGHVTAD